MSDPSVAEILPDPGPDTERPLSGNGHGDGDGHNDGGWWIVI